MPAGFIIFSAAFMHLYPYIIIVLESPYELYGFIIVFFTSDENFMVPKKIM